MKKYRIKKDVVTDWGLPCLAFKVQMRVLGFVWLTVKTFIDEYGMSGQSKGSVVENLAYKDANELLDLLELPC